jgi:hypothetical protein
MRVQETLERIAYSSKDVSREVSDIKAFILQTTEDKEAFFWLDEILQEIVQSRPDSRLVTFYQLFYQMILLLRL